MASNCLMHYAALVQAQAQDTAAGAPAAAATSAAPAAAVPAAAAAAAKPSEAADWKEYTSPDGRKYYYNRKTKESRWTMPEEMKQAQVAAATAASQVQKVPVAASSTPTPVSQFIPRHCQ